MTLGVGLVLAAGVLLIASRWLWPPGASRVRRANPVVARCKERLVQAGLPRVGVGTVVAVSGVLGVAAASIALATLSVLAIAVAAGVVAAVVPALMIGARARARRSAGRGLWPDLVDQLVSGVRSGLALPDALVVLAHTGPAQTRAAFAEFEAEYRVTGNFSLCIDALKDRLADPVADRIIETLRMSREVGGTELTTVLRNLGSYLRQEGAIRSEVEARQSWVVNAARLGVAAPWVVLMLLATRPEAAASYNSPAGITLIVGGLVVSVIAYRLMRGLGRLPDERRWFA